jgi:phosphoglycolate phosphatase
MSDKAIIFDLDGTLLDTVTDLADSMNASLAEAGFPVHSREEYIAMIGSGLRSLVSLALPPGSRVYDSVERVLAVMNRVYPARMTDATRPYPGIPGLLDEISSRGIPKAILSNKPEAMTIEIVKKLLGKWSFDLIIGSSARFPKKPDPKAALAIAESFGIRPGRMIFIGDSPIDVQTARNAGMIPVCVAWGYGDHDEMMKLGLKELIDTPEELVSVIDRIR